MLKLKTLLLENENLKPLAAFKDFDNKWNYYQLGLNPKYPDAYIRIDDPQKVHGFDKDQVKKYGHRFIQGDSVEELQKKVAKSEHESLHGSGVEGDVACPNCGYKYKPNPCDDEYGHINDSYETVIKCICGKRLHIEVEDVVIKYKVKLI